MTLIAAARAEAVRASVRPNSLASSGLWMRSSSPKSAERLSEVETSSSLSAVPRSALNLPSSASLPRSTLPMTA